MSPPQHPPIAYVMFLRPRAKSSDKSIPFRTTSPISGFFTPLFYSFIFRSPMVCRCDVYLFSEIFASGFVVVEKSAFFLFIKFYFVYETRGKKPAVWTVWGYVIVYGVIRYVVYNTYISAGPHGYIRWMQKILWGLNYYEKHEMKSSKHTNKNFDRAMCLFLTHRQRNIAHVTDDGTISEWKEFFFVVFITTRADTNYSHTKFNRKKWIIINRFLENFRGKNNEENSSEFCM